MKTIRVYLPKVTKTEDKLYCIGMKFFNMKTRKLFMLAAIPPTGDNRKIILINMDDGSYLDGGAKVKNSRKITHSEFMMLFTGIDSFDEYEEINMIFE